MSKHLLTLFLLICFFLTSEGSLIAQSGNGGTQATAEVSLDELKIYPNPTTDFFQISNGIGVKKVIIYNMFGKEVKSFFYFNNAQYDVMDLRSGMYIVKMMDEKNKIVRSVKLHKNFSGV